MSEETAVAYERKATEKVNLDTIDSELVEDKIEINPDVNPLEVPPPILDGLHRVKLTGASDWEQGETKPLKTTGEPMTFYKTQFRAQVIDEDQNKNKLAFGAENTLTFDGKNVMAYIIKQVLMGSTMGQSKEQAAAFLVTLDTPLKLAKAFSQCLAGEPTVKVKTKWIIRYNAGTKEEPNYKTHLSGMNNFPRNVDGTYRHIVPVKGAGELAAKAEITDYFPD